MGLKEFRVCRARSMRNDGYARNMLIENNTERDDKGGNRYDSGF